MKMSIKKKFAGIAAAFVLVAATLFVPAVPTFAAECSQGVNGGVSAGINCAQGEGVPSQDLFGSDSIFTTVVNILLFIIGAICVIMLIWGGIRYTTSAGNSSSVTAAKNTIMYAIIGLIIAFLAFAIVNWVLGAITPKA